MNENQVSTGGGGLDGMTLLAIVFITLKLCGVISWSWWWVLAPIWIPVAIVLLMIGIVMAAAAIDSLR